MAPISGTHLVGCQDDTAAVAAPHHGYSSNSWVQVLCPAAAANRWADNYVPDEAVDFGSLC